MMISDIPNVQLCVEWLLNSEIKHIVISPGSRNAPLALSLAADESFHCYSIVDERSAAFIGLGMAINLGQPIVLLCTSGSAILNYYPAVAEAYYSRVPLVVISADRPTNKIDIGDGQTIRQNHVLDQHCGFSTCLTEISKLPSVKLSADIRRDLTENIEKMKTALNSVYEMRLPVHINIPLEEPLYNFVSEASYTLSEFSVHHNSNQKEKSNPLELLSEVEEILNLSNRIMLLMGSQDIEEHNAGLVQEWQENYDALILTEKQSNLQMGRNVIDAIDLLIAPIELLENQNELFAELQPEVLITAGGMVVSKKVKSFLRQFPPKYHIHIDPNRAYDSYFCLSHHLKMSFNQFLIGIKGKKSKHNHHYSDYWNSHFIQVKALFEQYLKEARYSDLKVFDILSKNIRKKSVIHFSNSSPIRYAQFFSFPNSHIYCNRGTSGIDGSISTAIGFSTLDNRINYIVTGDLSFFYDKNAWWNGLDTSNVRVILINNGGGGIFRILPGYEDKPIYNTFLETQHNMSAKLLCAHYSLEYFRVDVESALAPAMYWLNRKGRSARLLEVFTPRETNATVLRSMFESISDGLKM